MDNYFTSIPLFQLLRERDIGACGTTRAGGLPHLLQELKRDHFKSLPWGTMCANPIDGVLCLAWQDNNLVLALSTIHSPKATVNRHRKRPAKTSTNGELVRKVFGSLVRKNLDIPIFIDDYNLNMGGVDLANQYRAEYETHRSTRRNWFPILYWLVDAAIVNAYRIQYIYWQQQGVPKSQLPSQLGFREKLYQELFKIGGSLYENLPPQRLDSQLRHVRILLRERSICMWCRYKTKHNLQKWTIPTTTSKSNRGCSACGWVLCLKKGCWEEFHTWWKDR